MLGVAARSREVGPGRGHLGELLAGPYGWVYLALVGFCIGATSYWIPAQLPIAAAVAGLIVGVLLRGNRVVVGGRPGMAVLAYGSFVALSVPFSIWLGPSVAGLKDVVKLLVVFLVTLNAVTTRKRVLWLIAILVLLITVFPAAGAVEYYVRGMTKGEGRANWRGFYGNPNMVALTTVMFLPFAATLFTLRRSPAWRMLWGAACVVLVVATILTKSRAGFLALAMMGAGSLVLSRRRVAIAAAVLLAGVGITLFAPQDFGGRVRSIFAASEERDYSAQSRVVIWRVAVEIALSRPLTGIGVGTYQMANAQRAPDELGTAGGQRWVDTHSTFLNIWAEIGTPGLVAFVSAIVLLLRRSWRTVRTLPRGDPLELFLRAGIVSMLTFMVVSVFNTFHEAWYFYVIFALMIAMIRQAREAAAAPLSPSP